MITCKELRTIALMANRNVRVNAQTAITILFILSCVDGQGCYIGRSTVDSIETFDGNSSCTGVSNPCNQFGSSFKSQNKCTCECPSYKPTYMENTNSCMTNRDVWSSTKCTLKSKRGSFDIPLFATNNRQLSINTPRKFRRCTPAIDKTKSYFLHTTGWRAIYTKAGFPFKIRSSKRTINISWNTAVKFDGIGKVIRLGITCRWQKECVVFKIPGKKSHKCLPAPTSVPTSPTAMSTASTISPIITAQITATKNVDMTTEKPQTPSHQPSVSNKDKSSAEEGTSGGIIGAVVGALVVLLLIIILLAFCWRRKICMIFKNWKEKLTSSQNSGNNVNSAAPGPEVPYASPHHPYQELKPPGPYQSLSWNTKEDPSGYLVPSEPRSPDPLYNEIGNPGCESPPVYDYAMPEDIVRPSLQHLSNKDLRMAPSGITPSNNGPDYIGRPSEDQRGPPSSSLRNDEIEASSGANTAKYQESPGISDYFDFATKESSQRRNSNDESGEDATNSPEYQTVLPRDIPADANQTRNTPFPKYEPLRLSRGDLGGNSLV